MSNSGRKSHRAQFARMLALWGAVGALGGMGGCGSDDSPAPPPPAPAPAPVALTCDDTMKTAFKPDANTSVVLVKSFKQGDPLVLSGTPASPAPPTAAADLCLVKIVVGPGFQDTPASAPSSSPGIGIEVWLPTPSAWNNRIHNLGGGGWAGGQQGNTALIGSTGAATTAGTTRYVVGTTDTGHNIGNGSFAMRQDGGINSTLWNDFAERSLHELAVKTKALVQGFYGKPQQFAYWDGCSTGGRQGYKIAQTHPDDYNGYLVGAPAFNWTKFITNELYPQIVMQQDLGGPLPAAKQAFVGGAAVSACDVVGTQHLGFILDPLQCRYDPTKDANVLCSGVQGNGVVGASTNASCVNLREAQALNKIWYGQTADGTAPDPLQDNASSATLTTGNHLWWGLTRGTNLAGLAGTNPFSISTDMVALELQDPTLATTSFINGTGNGSNRWRQLTYSDLANAYNQGISLQSFFGDINTDNPDLTKARDSGAKLLSYHGLADVLIAPQGSINYFTRLSNVVGGFVEAQKFDRLYLIPGMGHCAGVGTLTGSAGPTADANSVPLPAAGQLFNVLVDWVEKNTAPTTLLMSSANASVTLPVCPYPQKATYNGTGSVTAASSYSCK